MTAAISFFNVTLGYNRHPAVHHVDTEVEAGSLTALVGPNGSGKSTLLKGITGSLAPLEGDITLRANSRREVAYLPQQSEIDPAFPISVEDLISMGIWRETGAFGGTSRPQRRRIRSSIDAVGLAGFERRPIETLSGGQMQRALFARLLLQDADIVLLDEPFTAIDSTTTTDLLRVIQQWHNEGRTVITVLHDIETVREWFPNSMLMARDLIAHGPTGAVLTAQNLARAWRMTPAFDGSAPTCNRRAA